MGQRAVQQPGASGGTLCGSSSGMRPRTCSCRRCLCWSLPTQGQLHEAAMQVGAHKPLQIAVHNFKYICGDIVRQFCGDDLWTCGPRHSL